MRRHPPIKNPRPDELIAFATNQVFKAYAKKHNIIFISDDTESIRDAIINSKHTNKIGFNKVFESINKKIPLMVDKVFSSNNKVSGDWLLYKKDSNGENYHLDFTVHVDAGDKQRQIELRDSLLTSFQSLIQRFCL